MLVRQAIFPVAGSRHPLPARHQGPAQGDAAGGRQAADPVRGRGGLRRRRARDDLRHRPPQAADRGPLRHAPSSWRYALEQAGKHELLDVVRSVKPDDMECIYVRQAQALGLGHAVLCGQRLVGDEPFAVLLADDLMVGDAAGADADGRAVRRVAGVDPRRAGGAGRAHPALRHRRRHAGRASG